MTGSASQRRYLPAPIFRPRFTCGSTPAFRRYRLNCLSLGAASPRAVRKHSCDASTCFPQIRKHRQTIVDKISIVQISLLTKLNRRVPGGCRGDQFAIVRYRVIRPADSSRTNAAGWGTSSTVQVLTAVNRSPKTFAIASTLDSLASRPSSIARTVPLLGIPAIFATAYHVKPRSVRTARMSLPIPPGVGGAAANLRRFGGNSAFTVCRAASRRAWSLGESVRSTRENRLVMCLVSNQSMQAIDFVGHHRVNGLSVNQFVNDDDVNALGREPKKHRATRWTDSTFRPLGAKERVQHLRPSIRVLRCGRCCRSR